MHRTTVWLRHDDDELLREVSFRTRRTKSDLIREAVRLICERYAAPTTPADPDEIVSPRVLPVADDWIFTPTEEAVISLRGARLSPAAIAEELVLTESQVLVLMGRIDDKLHALARPEDPISFAGT
jgi:DNA-binding CsgD family transcriptional regulator